MNIEVEYAGIAACRCVAGTSPSVCPLATTPTPSSTSGSSEQALRAGEAPREQIRRGVCWRVQEPRPHRRRALARLLTPVSAHLAADRTHGPAPHAHPGESAEGSRRRIDQPPRARRREVERGSRRLLTPIVEKSAAKPRRASSRRTSRRCRTPLRVSALRVQTRRKACRRGQGHRPEHRGRTHRHRCPSMRCRK